MFQTKKTAVKLNDNLTAVSLIDSDWASGTS